MRWNKSDYFRKLVMRYHASELFLHISQFGYFTMKTNPKNCHLKSFMVFSEALISIHHQINHQIRHPNEANFQSVEQFRSLLFMFTIYTIEINPCNGIWKSGKSIVSSSFIPLPERKKFSLRSVVALEVTPWKKE